MPTSARTPWLMLALISAGFIVLTLNWFDLATAFPEIGATFNIGLGELGNLVSLFIIGYAIAHIPGGMVATAIGMKRAMAMGLAVQGVAGILSGLATSYTALAWFRVISGVGGSIFIAVAFGAVIAWFHGGRVTLALGVAGGAAFSAGAAFALYVWVYLQRATSWQTSLIIAGILELIVAFATLAWFRVPQGAGAARETFDLSALKVAIASRDLWIYGIALMGGYGAYFATSQLFTEYAVAERGFDASRSGLLAALIVLAGVPGGILGGMMADRSRDLRAYIVAPLLVVAALVTLIPLVSTPMLWVLGVGIGFFMIYGFAAWSSVPSRVSHIPHHHIGTASGLMLTLAGIGGYFVPKFFAQIVPHTSFDTGWYFLAAASCGFALIGLLGHNPSLPPSAPSPLARPDAALR